MITWVLWTVLCSCSWLRHKYLHWYFGSISPKLKKLNFLLCTALFSWFLPLSFEMSRTSLEWLKRYFSMNKIDYLINCYLDFTLYWYIYFFISFYYFQSKINSIYQYTHSLSILLFSFTTYALNFEWLSVVIPTNLSFFY